MRVGDLMQKRVKNISPDASMAELVQTLADSRVSGLPVVSTAGHVVGVVSATDVLEASAKSAEREKSTTGTRMFEQVKVNDIMTPNPYLIGPDAAVEDAARQMLYGGVRRLFVESDGRLVGVISESDIAYAIGSGRLKTRG